MEIGKLSNELLERLVIRKIKNKRKEVLTRASIGEDCAVIDFGEYSCVLSTDPITGASNNIGGLAINVSCNDVASNGAEPIGVLMTIMAPPGTKEEDIASIMEDAGQAAEVLNVEIVGGHTEITDAVNRIVVTTTVVGRQLKEKTLKAQDVNEGDIILMTKTAGIEGTYILANELERELKYKVTEDLLNEAKGFEKDISVVKEGIICGNIGVKYMHDVTEGGILGAIWEASRAIGKGVIVNKEDIPIAESTKEICSILSINPLRLISSGSMIIICEREKKEVVIRELTEEGIRVSVIGEVTRSDILLKDKEGVIEISPPESDELYKALKN
jgi:hydrogenase expression/formation protein HypE